MTTATGQDDATGVTAERSAVDSNRRRLLIAGAAVAIGARSHDAVAATRHVVTIDAFEFKPAALTARNGDEIEWRNTDPVPHTATARGAFDSGEIVPGKAWKLTASMKGRFDYVCAFHPTMRGTLVVS